MRLTVYFDPLLLWAESVYIPEKPEREIGYGSVPIYYDDIAKLDIPAMQRYRLRQKRKKLVRS
jgi:hypothetical protein